MSPLLHSVRQIHHDHDLGPYDTARRRRARMAVPLEVRQAASRAGGLAKAAKVGSVGMAAMGRLGGPGKLPPDRRSALAAAGARALNAKAGLEQKRIWGRLGGPKRWRKV